MKLGLLQNASNNLSITRKSRLVDSVFLGQVTGSAKA